GAAEALSVVRRGAGGRAEQGRERADGDDGGLDGLVEAEDGVGAGDEVDAGGDHGGGVDERRDRGGAFHGVGEPGLERPLPGLAAGGGEEEQADGEARAFGQSFGAVEDGG